MGKAASKKSRPGRRRAGPGAAFTLIELLVVIAIISLLVGILVPVVSMAVRKAEDSRCRARVLDLATACNQYHFEHEYYPGQQYPGRLGPPLPPPEPPRYSGSQWLARTLFTDLALAQTNPPQPHLVYPQPKYAKVKPVEDLMEPKVTDRLDIDGTSYLFQFGTIADRTTRAMPILYYPARPGLTGTETVSMYGQQQIVFREYRYADNAIHTGQDDSQAAWNFRKFITIPDGEIADMNSVNRTDQLLANDRPNHHGAFLIIAAGMDRVYFTGDDVRYPVWQD